MTVGEDRRGHVDCLADGPFDRKAAAVDLRLNALDDDAAAQRVRDSGWLTAIVGFRTCGEPRVVRHQLSTDAASTARSRSDTRRRCRSGVTTLNRTTERPWSAYRAPPLYMRSTSCGSQVSKTRCHCCGPSIGGSVNGTLSPCPLSSTSSVSPVLGPPRSFTSSIALPDSSIPSVRVPAAFHAASSISRPPGDSHATSLTPPPRMLRPWKYFRRRSVGCARRKCTSLQTKSKSRCLAGSRLQ